MVDTVRKNKPILSPCGACWNERNVTSRRRFSRCVIGIPFLALQDLSNDGMILVGESENINLGSEGTISSQNSSEA